MIRKPCKIEPQLLNALKAFDELRPGQVGQNQNVEAEGLFHAVAYFYLISNVWRAR